MKENHGRGVIRNLEADGGLLKIYIEAEDGRITTLVGDNGPTVRALMHLFGPNIVAGHTILVNLLIGQELGYTVDENGLLALIEA